MSKNDTKVRLRMWNKATEMHIPLSGAFELLPLCNLQCKMCYVRKSIAEVRDLGGLLVGEQWLDYAQQACKMGLLYPLITGGEPLLHPDFKEIFAGICDMGMQASINTNGTLIDRKTAAWFGKHVPTRINITLYGASEETYENQCGDGEAFRRVCDAVQFLKEYNIPIKFNASITPHNMFDLENIIHYAKKMECPIQIATYMFPPLRRDSTMIGENDRLLPETAGRLRVLGDYLQNEIEWFMDQARNYQRFVPITEQMEVLQKRGPMKMNCRAGVCSFWLDWQGNLSNCGMFTSSKKTLLKKSFSEEWEKIVEETGLIRYEPPCAICPNMRICGPCIAMVYNECGDINGRPEYLCKMNQASAKYYQLCARAMAEGKDPLKILMEQKGP